MTQDVAKEVAMDTNILCFPQQPNKHSLRDDIGNLGNHPFKNLPDGQVCLP